MRNTRVSGFLIKVIVAFLCVLKIQFQLAVHVLYYIICISIS